MFATALITPKLGNMLGGGLLLAPWRLGLGPPAQQPVLDWGHAGGLCAAGQGRVPPRLRRSRHPPP